LLQLASNCIENRLHLQEIGYFLNHLIPPVGKVNSDVQ